MLLYSLKAALLLTLLYLPYLWLLHGKKLFHFNRALLVGIMLLSLLFPLVPQHAPLQFATLGGGFEALESLQENSSATPTLTPSIGESRKATGWAAYDGAVWQLFTWLYAIVAVCLLATRLWGFVRMQRIVRRGCIRHLRQDGLHIYIHAGETAPFSWGRSVVISQADYDAGSHAILLHETGHIRLCHSADVALLTLCQMLQWFNPFVWMMGRTLTDLHEYEADNYVLRQGADARGYQRLLLQRAAGSSAFALVQHFGGAGLVGKRIRMMHAAAAQRVHRLRAVYVLPVLLVANGVFATSEFREIRDEVVRRDPTVPFIAKVMSATASTPQDSPSEEVSTPASVAPQSAAPDLLPPAEDAATAAATAPEAATPASTASTHDASPYRGEPEAGQHTPTEEIIETRPIATSSSLFHQDAASLLPPASSLKKPAVAEARVKVEVNPESERLIDLGYGREKKKNVSSHVNGYTGEELLRTGYRTLPEALAHRVAGLLCSGGRLVYRDSYVTLFFIDDVRTSSLEGISLGDIDYVEFDSEAFIYGTQGHYAIRVHTKR